VTRASERLYRFNLTCPRCGKVSETTTPLRNPPPKVSCGECLMDDVEIVELKIASVEVLHG
jgi:transcription elongation factor Elf1